MSEQRAVALLKQNPTSSGSPKRAVAFTDQNPTSSGSPKRAVAFTDQNPTSSGSPKRAVALPDQNQNEQWLLPTRIKRAVAPYNEQRLYLLHPVANTSFCRTQREDRRSMDCQA